MRHRLGGLENTYMGLGFDNVPFVLDNTLSDNQDFNNVVMQMFQDALPALFSDIGGFDFKVTCNGSSFKVLFGFEPAYKGDPYRMCCITDNKADCYIETGVATEYYGMDVRIDSKLYAVPGKGCPEFADLVGKWFRPLCDATELGRVEQ